MTVQSTGSLAAYDDEGLEDFEEFDEEEEEDMDTEEED